jgi:hypothetical protein
VSDPAKISPEVPATPEIHEAHLIQQADVPPLDVDGVQAATVGTAVFAIATAIMAVGYDSLAAAGDGWWLGVGVSGFGLGLISLGYTISRRRRRHREGSVAPD